MPRATLPALLVLLAALALPLAACGGGEPAAGPAADAEQNDQEHIALNGGLGIAVVFPDGGPFELEANEGGEIRLRFVGDDEHSPGTVTYRVEPEQDYGVNLVEAVNARKAELEKMPGGEFLGQIELGSHLGTAYSTRGRFTGEAGRTVEAVRVFAVHPTANRLLHMTYRYEPAPGQTAARFEHATTAFGYVEALPAAAEEGTETAGAVPAPGAAEGAPAADAPADAPAP
jgi:hypothetical protein